MADEFFLIIPILGKLIPKMELKAALLLERGSIALEKPSHKCALALLVEERAFMLVSQHKG